MLLLLHENNYLDDWIRERAAKELALGLEGNKSLTILQLNGIDFISS